MPLFGKPDISKLISKRDINGLIRALSDNEENIRCDAAKALRGFGDVRATEPLIKAFKDESSSVRRYAIEAFIGIRDPHAIGPLITMLNGPERTEAADALVKIGRPSVELLIAALDNENFNIQFWAAWSLATLGDMHGVPILLRAMETNHPDADWAVRAISTFRSVDVVMPLVSVLQNNITLPNNRQFGLCFKFWLDILDTIRDAPSEPKAAEPLLNWYQNAMRINNTGFYTYKDDISTEVLKNKMIDALAACGQEAVPTLVINIKKYAQRDVATLPAFALQKLGWTPESDEERLNYALARHEWTEAGKLGAIAQVPLLEKLIHTDEFIEKIEIARGLGLTGHPSAVEALMTILTDEMRKRISGVHETREAAANALVALGDVGFDALQTRILGMNNDEYYGFSEAVEALAKSGPTGLQKLGIAMKIHSEARSRYAQRNAKDSKNPGDPDYRGWRMWEIIHRTLVGLGNESLPLLRALLNDGNESVRTDAADFIAEISNKKKDGKSIN